MCGMSTVQSISRMPRPFDADKGREIAALVPQCTGETAELVAGAAGCSPYLAGLIEKEAAWLPGEAVDFEPQVLAEIADAANLDSDNLAKGLRRAKRRVALVTALADLGGIWPLEKVTKTLTDLGDAACTAALRAAILRQIRRNKLPGMRDEDAETAAGMVILAMGKMGAHELNYSSDIDLICLFDETRFDPRDFMEARAAFVRATREMSATLSEMTADGYVFRTDLRLRPDPSVTPVCIAMEAAEQYYESLGRTWERAAYIKARPAAGDLEAGQRFLRALQPFVWRRHLDFAAIQDAHDMRLAIRSHKGLGGPITLPGHNMKLGRGGIREIEFFTQTRQLIAGGRDPDLRCSGTVAGLAVLAEKGWVDAPVASALTEHYRAHRTVEHRLQMVQDAQTHSLPKSGEGFERLAAMMGTDVHSLKRELEERLEAVHEMTEGFFAPTKSDTVPLPAFFDDETLARWMSYPALRSARAREVFERVKPDLLSRLSDSASPQDAIMAFDGFLSGLPAGVQLFALLEANPSLTDLVIDVSATSPMLAQYLSRNAGVFDAVIGGDFFTPWPGQTGLEKALSAALERENDYERKLDATRRWFKEWHFRIGVHLLRGLVTTGEATQQYSDLARAVLAVVWPLVADEFSSKYGTPPGRGAVVLGMGSLGAGTLNAGSDLDLIVIYDPLNEDASKGKKSLPARLYYARLTQSLITALSAPMAQGKLFDVDMRLRPSGNQGPVATSWQSFQAYQKEEAWLWEHLALTRAAVVAGPRELASDVSAFRIALLSRPAKVADVAREVARMRERIQQAKAPSGLLDAKIGAGRLQEIELLAQAGSLLTGETSHDTESGIDAAEKTGLVDAASAETLKSAAHLYAGLHTATRLLSDGPVEIEALGPGARAFLLRALEQPSINALEKRLGRAHLACTEILDAVLAPYGDTGMDE